MASTDPPCMVLCGTFVHSTEASPMDILPDHCIGVKDGKILFLVKRELLKEMLQKHDISEDCIRELKPGQFIVPGFVDTHIHASQYPNAGKGLDVGLLDWLYKYTFPTEAKFKDLEFAKDAYTRAVTRVLRNGTTTACYFATIHTDASLLLCDIVNKLGQRAFVGKVNMCRNCPDYYLETVQGSLSETERFIKEVLSRKYPCILPVVTPRFSVNCDSDTMKSLAELANTYNVPVQTHISETKDECKWVSELFPEKIDYLDTYDSAGLISKKTVLAHGIYLTDRERASIKSKGAGISHCPNSNLAIRSGLLDVKQLLEEGIPVGLGTDVSGGYSPSILDAMRTALQISDTLAIQRENYDPINFKHAFMMATLGGSKVMNLEDEIGNFVQGKQFDALVIDPNAEGTCLDIFEHDTEQDIIQKFIYLGDDRNIQEIYVRGIEVSRNLKTVV